MDFGKKLQNLRKGKKLSQEELAEKLKVSRQAVSKWESNQSYPEMEKLIEISKIFDCSLDDLTNDQTTSESIKNSKVKTPLNDFIDDLTSLINKTINMFTDMKGEEIFKVIFVMTLVAIGISILKFPVNRLYFMLENIFVNFGVIASGILSGLIYLILNIVYFIGGVLLFFYIYKVVFLDKYRFKKDETPINEEEKSKQEKNKDKEMVTLSKEITIKDTRKEWKVFSVIGKIVMFFVKIVAFFIAVPFICILVFLAFAIAISIYLIIKGVIIIGLPIILISSVMIIGVVICLINNLIFNKKTKPNGILVTFLGGIVLFGVGVGVIAVEATNYTFINEPPTNFSKQTLSQTFKMTNGLYYYETNKTHYVVDNNQDDILITIDYYDEMSTPKLEILGNSINVYSTDDERNFVFIKKMIFNLKEKKIYNYNYLFNYEITITTNEKNIESLQKAYNNDNILYENNLKQISALNDKINELEQKYEEKANELEEYKTKMKDLIN